MSLNSAIDMDFHTVLFDLDGTLTDPGLGITNSVMHALRHYGIPVPERESLFPFIGPPLDESFVKYFNMPQEQALEAIEVYREYFSVKGLLENSVYEGIEELLQFLRASGKRLMVATSKPEVFSVQILEHFDLAKYFDVISGAMLHPPKGYGKADVIREALNRANVTDLSGVVMVGDRKHDVEGAHKIGIPAIGVLYGYGNREEHRNCNADYIVETVEELKSCLAEK